MHLSSLHAKKEDNSDLIAIQQHEVLKEEIKSLAKNEKAAVMDILADKTQASCSGVSFEKSLAEFVRANQQKANENCQIIKGYVEGCYEGYMTYASAMVYPEPNKCGIVPETFFKPSDY